MRRWLPIVLLLVVAGIVVLFLLQRSNQAASALLKAADSQPHVSSERVEQALQVDNELHRATVPTPVETAASPVSDASTAHLSVRVLGKSSKGPVPMVRVILAAESPDRRGGYRSVGGQKGDLENAPITGEDGTVRFDLPPACTLQLRVRNEDERSRPREMEFPDSGTGGHSVRVSFEHPVAIRVIGRAGSDEETSVHVPALSAGEERELVLEIEDGLDGLVVGQVVCAETREPVAGARVRVLAGGQVRTEWHRPGPDEQTTGNDGRFELSFARRADPLLCVEAQEFGLRYVQLDGAREDGATPLVVLVSRAATLKVRVLDAVGAPLPEAWVSLDVTGYYLLHNEADAQGFFESGLPASPPNETWRVATSADGRAEIAGLPPRVKIGIKLENNGRVLRRDQQGLTLEPGEVKEVEWRVESGTHVRGLVLDQDGKPVSRIEIWASRATPMKQRFFLSSEQGSVASKTTTDAAGRFELWDLTSGTWCIGPGAVRGGDVASFAEIVELTGEPTRELTLNVARGLYIQGRVISPTGEPFHAAWVRGSGKADEYFEGVSSTRDGSFSFGPVTPGACTLTAHGGSFADSEPVRANAGDVDVVLQLRRGGTIRGHVLDGATGKACAVQLTFSPNTAIQSGYVNGMQTSTQPDGTFSISGLEPASWGVVATSSDGRFAIQSHIEVGPDTDSGDLVFTLNPGGRLQLSYNGSHPRLLVKILANGTLTALGTAVVSGKSIECLAPAGSLVIETREEFAGPARTKSVEIKAGETKEVVLKDED